MNKQKDNKLNLTIGIPVYNEEAYIEKAIFSAVTQCKTLLVSDNASTDNTFIICKALSQKYNNVQVFCHSKNLGTTFNFKYLLEQATTRYFMWLGGHDMLPAGYTDILLDRLENDSTAVMAYGASQHIGIHDEWISRYDYYFSDQLESDTARERLLAIIQNLSDCSLIHGIFRTEALKDAWNEWINLYTSVSYGMDQVFLGYIAAKGKMLYCDETYLLRRDVHLSDTVQKQLKRVHPEEIPSEENKSPRVMQQLLYNKAVEISSGIESGGYIFRLKARYLLANRRGVFGINLIEKYFDILLRSGAFRLIAKVYSWLMRLYLKT